MSASGSEGAQGAAQERPLDGVRVLDMSAVMTGPARALVPVDYGADVIRVELP
jgi:crotonobetainyl-CoA:carnitine CoA-transferase CaiB-like acyl-CoA transferase